MVARTPRVAVVDDDPRVLRALRRLLWSAGFDVDIYETGNAFLTAMAISEPNCLVLDLHMPRMSGFEVQARLAECRHRVPVVVITGDDTPAARSRALSLGARSYLCKPVEKAALLAAIAAAMQPAESGLL